jgi:hypothetical protein
MCHLAPKNLWGERGCKITLVDSVCCLVMFRHPEPASTCDWKPFWWYWQLFLPYPHLVSWMLGDDMIFAWTWAFLLVIKSSIFVLGSLSQFTLSQFRGNCRTFWIGNIGWSTTDSLKTCFGLLKRYILHSFGRAQYIRNDYCSLFLLVNHNDWLRSWHLYCLSLYFII